MVLRCRGGCKSDTMKSIAPINSSEISAKMVPSRSRNKQTNYKQTKQTRQLLTTIKRTPPPWACGGVGPLRDLSPHHPTPMGGGENYFGFSVVSASSLFSFCLFLCWLFSESCRYQLCWYSCGFTRLHVFQIL